ncbi:MAG TPA: sigma factor-like helix-turn-helix DNA-binding protein [Candidatus Paceibacterota bacterium]|nr:sigma factor-like helix-turn-helix DNA-binding protein [Candidatus Paceibacterota bacterium]
MFSATKILNTLLGALSDRQREVLAGRFGLEKFSEPQTLAALGAKYDVTRERVRQIETAGLATIREKISADPVCQDIIARSKKFLKDSGGVATREAFLANAQTFVSGLAPNHVSLLLEASRAFAEHPEDKNYRPFYYLDKDSLKLAANFINQWSAALKSKKKDVLEGQGQYDEHYAAFLTKANVSEAHAANYLAISKRVGNNPYGDKGLTEWAEIHPRTVRDRIYLVLKKQGKPLHFRTIAKSINEANFTARTASAPTVHNELIKDNRFVLVGRGTYGLAEHGYEPGTAREVIQRILKKNGALKPKDVMLAVQKERFFKPNTILVNLQNKNFFKRLSDGTYKVRES